METADLSKFGYIEIDSAIDLLKAYKEQGAELGNNVKIHFNTNSGYVFLCDEDLKVFMLDDEKNLSEWFVCEECNEEGFNFGFNYKQTEDLRNLCNDCYNNKKVNDGTK